MTVNGCKTVIKKDTAFGEHHPGYKETPLTDLHVHTWPARAAPEKFGLAVLRSAVHIRQREIRFNKKTRTVIPESNKNRNYRGQQDHLPYSRAQPKCITCRLITYNEQTFDDQVIEYFLILVRE